VKDSSEERGGKIDASSQWLEQKRDSGPATGPLRVEPTRTSCDR